MMEPSSMSEDGCNTEEHEPQYEPHRPGGKKWVKGDPIPHFVKTCFELNSDDWKQDIWTIRVPTCLHCGCLRAEIALKPKLNKDTYIQQQGPKPYHCQTLWIDNSRKPDTPPNPGLAPRKRSQPSTVVLQSPRKRFYKHKKSEKPLSTFFLTEKLEQSQKEVARHKQSGCNLRKKCRNSDRKRQKYIV